MLEPIKRLRELIDSEEFHKAKGKLSFPVGRDIEGKIIVGDIAKMPHMLIAGTTGSGKSVFTNSISNFINAFNQIKNDTVVEYYTTTYPVTVNLTTQTITIGSSQFICATQAENAASQILNGNGKHFIALRLKKPADVVMVASMPVSTNVAAAILAYDSSFAGVMSCDAASARQPCNLLGGIIRDEENHGINRIGYWTHYHAVLAPHAHSWFYSKIV